MTSSLPQHAGLYLALSNKPGAAVTGRYEVNGQPAQKFRKELIRVGQFTHPTHGYNFSVDSKMLDDWVETFSQMKADGEDVTLAASHANKVDEGRGYVREMFREDDSLYGIVECIGEDALRAAARANTSIYAENVFKSGNGKVYPWAIQHVALTTTPVVPGLKPFEAIAASREAGPDRFVLSLDSQGGDSMPEVLDPQAAEIDPKDAVRKSFKAMAMKVWDDETLEPAAFMAKVKELRKKLMDVLAKLGDDDPTNDPTPEELEAPEGSEVAAAVAASREGEAKKVDLNMVNLMAENRLGKLSLAVERGEITPAASKELSEMFIGKDNEKITLALSREDPDMFESTLKAVKAQGAAVKIGEGSGGQTLSLSNEKNDAGDNPLVAQAKKRREAANQTRGSR